MDMQKDMELKKSFQNPDRRHAIYPIIHGGVAANPSRAEHIERLGFAGIVGNVPYGEGYPDDDAEWQRTSDGFREFLKRGMHVWIYDEKGYPSGTAGGAVTDMNPDFIAQGLYCYEYWRTLSGPGPYRADVPGDKLYRAMLLPLDGGEAIDVTDTQNEHGTLKMHIPKGEYHLFMMSSRRLFDGTHAAESYSEPRNYISLSDKAATEAFISVTHEKYAQKLQDEFGKGVLAFFTDEPSLIAWNIRTAVYPIVPWHRDYPAQFAAKYGYPIELAVVAVVTKRGPQMLKRRCDFWEFIGDSVAANYFGTIQEWCHAHGMKSSGHFLEEERLQAHVYNYGSMYKCGKRMDWPGIDQLASEPSQLMYSGSIPIARLLASFADVSGEQETFTEFSDHSSRMANRQIGIEWVRASVNWHFAMGINNFTSYYGWENFDEKDIPPLNTYTARLGGLLRRGRRDSRVAVLYPEDLLIHLIFKGLIGLLSVLVAWIGYKNHKTKLNMMIVISLAALCIADVTTRVNLRIGTIFHMSCYGLLVYAYCQEEKPDWQQYKIFIILAAVSFGVTTGFDNGPETRTEYRGTLVTSGESRYERINWVPGTDRIRILCDDANDVKMADYKILSASVGEDARNSSGTVEPAGSDKLTWGLSGDHYFFALYPAAAMSGVTASEAVLEKHAT